MIVVDESDPVGEIQLSFPYKDVVIRRGVDCKEFYELKSEIGRGKFGTVYRCIEKSTGLELAAKFIPVSRKEDRRNVEREIDIMRSLQHPRLIQMYDAFDSGKIMSVILELIEGGELFERVIDDDFILTEKACTIFMRQICEAIEFIHKQHILHLDMKPENILCLTKTGNRVKIIDFGLARRFDPNKKLQVLFGTPEFVAPEVVNFDQIGFGTDMWSIGVICYVLLSGLSPFMGETDVQTMANVTIAKFDFDDEAFNNISEDAKDFIRKLLLKDKEKRMTAKECLEHAWLRPKAEVPLKISPSTGLDVTKDNLRSFVERWTDHPNSPYLFDVSCHTISVVWPVPLLVSAGMPLSSSQHSLRGMSPSPCGSLSSTSPDSVTESDLAAGSGPCDVKDFSHYMFDKISAPLPHVHRNRILQEYQGLERRASDSSCIMQKADIAERVNLAEEIRKLSDKLFKMSTIPTTEFHVESKKLPTAVKIEDSNSCNNNNTAIPSGNGNSSLGISSKRTKFKMTSMNRDVPLNNYTNQTVLMKKETNADGTKDLLLQLLDKWDDSQEHSRPKTGRHKSISAEWSDIETLGQRTISSLNTFFKSRTTSKNIHPFVAMDGVK